uniref:Ankyrin repeat-containing protein n=1 Tax=Borely moumouvirus TaxID=2712067 RepID=A0A6G6ADR8_9VIRU
MAQNIGEYSYETSFPCSQYTISKYFTKLMYLIITERNHPNGHQRIINYLKDNKNRQKINQKNEKGWTALMIACRNSNIWSSIETVKLLLKFGADVNLQNNDGWTALMLASRNSNKSSNIGTVKLLLEANSNINLQNNDGLTALMLSSGNLNKICIKTIKLLLNYNSDPNIKCINGFTVFKYVSKQVNLTNIFETLLLLLDHGANKYYEIKTGSFNEEQLKIYYELLAQKNYYKMTMDYIHKTIKNHVNKILYNPNSIRSQLLFMKLVSENNSVEKCITFKNLEIFDYLAIYDLDSLKIKLCDIFKYID